VVLIAFTPGCHSAKSGASPEPNSPTPLPGGVLAEVNGVAITRQELQAELMAGKGHGGPALPPENALLYALVEKELAAQRALVLGLGSDPDFQNELRRREAELITWKRKRLAELFFRKEVEGRISVDQSEARKYYDANLDKIRTELHVLQIFTRDESGIEEARRALEAGTAFVEEARRQFPKLPEGAAPWDLGYLKWNQLPAPWIDEVNRLSEGQTSGVIRGSNHRYWLLHLVGKRTVNASFETMQTPIVNLLRSEKLDRRREQVERELRAKANIVYAKSALILPLPTPER
jgi:parvulin-like peptidyl-prolyl isomerase